MNLEDIPDIPDTVIVIMMSGVTITNLDLL